MELKNKDQIRNEILQSWVKDAWMTPVRGPNNQVFLRLTPGGRLKVRRRIKELEERLGVSGSELAKQDEENTIPVEREKLELAMMVRAYTSERKLMEAQGITLGPAAVSLEEEQE
ncbi:hypothetical protein E0L93_02295 [Rubrobacter taiwanensis]|uniref:Uncharacterized protein n=1 Tax=Rubrobacter taiwanensis TaxID=185139 RepID=A0A4R1BQ60_9ACTN|nr:hypothetical protein [Rubrobacter taiwanensis]TCJ19810.1 hypothetical protein E0L93_02295 [Rubrobacter taiwanensis]